MYREDEYWGKPLVGFGDPHARLLIVGLAPAAHGGNRTGRMFTGDRSGEFLFRALFEAGFANQPTSVSRDDGLALNDAYITAAVRCAPPDNKPTPIERERCQPYLEQELRLLNRVQAVLALGRVAFEVYLRAVSRKAGTGAEPWPPRSHFRFGHGASYALPGGLPRLYASYHPSQQNTQTGKLTDDMFLRVLRHVRAFLETDRD